MKLSAAFSLISDFILALRLALIPTFKDIWAKPSLIFHLGMLSSIFMAHVWIVFGPGTDEGASKTKAGLLTGNASGIVLDVGAGHGHTAKYLDRAKVSKYIALEPNRLMHPHIHEVAGSAGFDIKSGSLVILPYTASQLPLIRNALEKEGCPNGQVNTLVSILTMCTVPDAELVMSKMVRELLSPGGSLLFYEHVLSQRPDVAWWQRFWSPMWKIAFDGCRLDRPTHLWIKRMKDYGNGPEGGYVSMWQEAGLWGKEGEPEEHLFWHQAGRFVKHV